MGYFITLIPFLYIISKLHQKYVFEQTSRELKLKEFVLLLAVACSLIQRKSLIS